MFSPVDLVIDAYCEELKAAYYKLYGILEPEYPNIIAFCGRMALENIANSDAAYHDTFHTIVVTDVGQQILRGKHISVGGVSPDDWLHFVVSLLCHDIGYVRGVCRDDRDGSYVAGLDGARVEIGPEATDAALTPYHVERGKIFVRERFGKVPQIDVAAIEANIEGTVFPVPRDGEHAGTGDDPGLLRAADLIGQLADVGYLKKCALLYYEFRETGVAERLGYDSPADVRRNYPKFFWSTVRPYLDDAVHFLNVTQEGKIWVNNLYANVFAQEHANYLSGRNGRK
jgi:hypothetical protein